MNRTLLKLGCAVLLMLSGSIRPAAAQQAAAAPVPAVNAVEAKLDVIIEKMEQSQQTLETALAKVGGAEKAEPLEKVAAEAEPSAAVDDAGAAAVQSNLNLVWMILAGALVFLMQAGFALVELGFARAKNSINILMKNFLDFCISVLVFLFLGFGLMFGSSAGGWIGTDGFWLSTRAGDDPLWAFWFFQAVFAGTACTIVSGAMAERTKFIGYLTYAAFLTAIVYPLGGHWAWGSFGGGYGVGGTQGWLEALGFVDFAGSTVVHGCGGACALAGIIVVGARHGRFDADGAPRLIAGHNIPLAALGVFLLWLGWFGFNAGSTLLGEASIGRIVVNTTVAPAVGALAAMVSMWFIQGRPDIGITLNGALGGLVGVTACCANITPASAAVVGLVAGLLTTVATIGLERLGLDDAVGAVPVHLVNGWWGTLAVALFDEAGFSAEKLGVQALGTASITGAAFVLCYVIFKVVDLTVGLRASATEQMDGLDFSEHSANAYPDFSTTDQA
jgi:ammonium transporter, Amt family